MQVGLLRSQQFGLCRTHITTLPQPLQLRMYAEESRFPHRYGMKPCDPFLASLFVHHFIIYFLVAGMSG